MRPLLSLTLGAVLAACGATTPAPVVDPAPTTPTPVIVTGLNGTVTGWTRESGPLRYESRFYNGEEVTFPLGSITADGTFSLTLPNDANMMSAIQSMDELAPPESNEFTRSSRPVVSDPTARWSTPRIAFVQNNSESTHACNLAPFLKRQLD